MAAIASIVSRRGLTIEACHTNQSRYSKLALYKPLIYFYSHLKQLYLSNKVECLSYKGGCDISGCRCVKMFIRRASLGYR